MALFHKNIQKHLGWAVIMSELSHIFCCVIPTLVTILSVFANLGLFVIAPNGILTSIHNKMHSYEIPILVFSGVMVGLGWLAHWFSSRFDCHDTGCHHPPCPTKSKNNSRILVIATILFLMNMIVYFGIHRNILDFDMFRPPVSEHHTEDEHHHE